MNSEAASYAFSRKGFADVDNVRSEHLNKKRGGTMPKIRP